MNIVELREVERSERPNACCRDAQNLRCEALDGRRFIEHCCCGRRHFIVEVDAGVLGLLGS